MQQGITDAPIIAGCCGDEWAAEFLAFIKIWKDLPSLNKIMLDPSGTPVPERSAPGTLFALSGALSRSMTHETAGQLMVYVDRMPIEFAAMIVRYATKRDNTLHEHNSVNRWCLQNFNLL
jgi:hypothetical protein